MKWQISPPLLSGITLNKNQYNCTYSHNSFFFTIKRVHDNNNKKKGVNTNNIDRNKMSFKINIYLQLLLSKLVHHDRINATL